MRISDWSSDVCSSDLLAAGNGRADFLTAYAGFLGQYLDLIRSGAAPSSFESASLGNINAFLAYAGRTGRLADLGAQDRVLAQAYPAFLRGGGNPDKIGRAHVCTPVTNAQIVCSLVLEKKKNSKYYIPYMATKNNTH